MKKLKSNNKINKIRKMYLAYQLGISCLNSTPHYQNSAVMFDIDDTLLEVTNRINPFKPIKQIINLLYECANRNILILIITARDSKYRKETIKHLDKYKIPYSFLYLRQSPNDDHDLFKSIVKQNLYENYGINCIMSVGDNLIDVVGNYSGYGIKLPNKSDPNLYQYSYGNLEKI